MMTPKQDTANPSVTAVKDGRNATRGGWRDSGRTLVGAVVLAFTIGLGGVWHFASAKGTSSAVDMTASARAFLARLNAKQKKAASFSFEDAERDQWHYVPKDRTGVCYKDLNAKQKQAAHALLKTALSVSGHNRATGIMALEGVLAEMEKDPVKRDPEKYWFSFFGKPTPEGTWSWSFEGHHVSLNITVVKGELVATTPTFLGANPAEVRSGSLEGTRMLGPEEDVGRALVKSLRGYALKKALGESVAAPEILTGAESRVQPLQSGGLAYEAMDERQRALVDKLIGGFGNTLKPGLAAERLAGVEKAGKAKIRFTWSGPTEPGKAHAFTLQGPTFLMEYNNTQNGANHAHAVWRDFKGDFGRDLLAEHLQASH